MAVFKGVPTAKSKRRNGNRKSRKADRSKLCKLKCIIAAKAKKNA